jgi:hypothetical protein
MTVEDTEVGAMEPETEMDAIEPLNPLHMRKFLNLVSKHFSFQRKQHTVHWLYCTLSL